MQDRTFHPIGIEQALKQILLRLKPSYAEAEERLAEKMKPAKLVPLDQAWQDFQRKGSSN